jgi:hypothetical protein
MNFAKKFIFPLHFRQLLCYIIIALNYEIRQAGGAILAFFPGFEGVCRRQIRRGLGAGG